MCLKTTMNPLRIIKKKLYFSVAAYFSFFAAIYLKRWNPMIITVTGSSGKTTLLHLFEAQLGEKAVYSHKANSAFGIPFHILGLERISFAWYEWLFFFILAPFKAYRPIYGEKIYVTEVDAERPYEAQSLAKLLHPDMLVWLSLEEAHGINYDILVKNQSGNMTDMRKAVKQEMAQEFGTLLQHIKTYAVLNSDNAYIQSQAARTKAEIKNISEKDIQNFQVEFSSVVIASALGEFKIPNLIPKNAALSVLAVASVLKKLNVEVDTEFKNFSVPPGRSSVFPGIQDTILIDSSYNATFDGVTSMLDLMTLYPAQKETWLVLGDMIEQGKSEVAEHMDIAQNILAVHPSRIILVGPRLQKNTLPILEKELGKEKVASFMRPDEALVYIQKELKGGETILFKGARFLEGIVERLLADPSDAIMLCRREKIWQEKRKEWGV